MVNNLLMNNFSIGLSECLVLQTCRASPLITKEVTHRKMYKQRAVFSKSRKKTKKKKKRKEGKEKGKQEVSLNAPPQTGEVQRSMLWSLTGQEGRPFRMTGHQQAVAAFPSHSDCARTFQAHERPKFHRMQPTSVHSPTMKKSLSLFTLL